MRIRPHKTIRNLTSERLEERRLMAVDVMASGGDLVRYDMSAGEAESVAVGSQFAVASGDRAGRVAGSEGIEMSPGPLLGDMAASASATDMASSVEFGVDALPSIVIGNDDRTEVGSDYPFRTIGRIWTLWADGSQTSSSGAMIGQRHAITSGNAVYDASRGGWANQVHFSPSQDGNALYDPLFNTTFRRSDDQLYGAARAQSMTTFNGWVNDTNPDYNMGFLTLDRNIGDFTGWMGWGYNDDNGFFQGSIANHSGYPGDLTPGEYDQWADSGVISDVHTNTLYSNDIDNAPGQNGGPLWFYYASTDVRTMYGVSASHRSGVPDNGFARITGPRFETMQNLIDTDGPAADRPDLVDWDQWFNTSFNSVSGTQFSIGDTLSATTVARNNGTASASASGSFTGRFRLSTDPTYDTSDVFLGDVAMPSVAALNYATLDLTTSIPSVAPGTYYVVYTIDPLNSVGEYEESNNTGYVRTPIQIGAAIAEDRYEQNDSIATATNLGTGNHTLNGLTIDQPNDGDFFSWTATSSGDLDIEARFTHALGDIDVVVYDPSGQFLTAATSISDNEFLTLPVVVGETYVVSVYGYAGATHPDYDLLLNFESSLPAEIHGTQWNDRNGDGIRDAGEEGLQGWTIYIDSNRNGQRDASEPTTTTDGNGNYTFSDVVPGEYVVAAVTPEGWLPTAPTERPDPPESQFQIDVIFGGGLSPGQQQIFATAADRWSEVITGDLPDVVTSIGLVDDLAIDARGVSIDGPGSVLGRAGPTSVRNGSFLPVRGIMEFDTADLAAMEANGQLFDVILHEMGHVLGLGTIWQDLGLITGVGGSNPRFTGAGATAEYNAIFGQADNSVPVEDGGGPGTAYGHWEESIFDNELMTGYINGDVVPLSRVTAAQFGDLGYQVNLDAADPFTPGIGGGGGDAPAESRGVVLPLDAPYEIVDVATETSLAASEDDTGSLPLPRIATPRNGEWLVDLQPGEILTGVDFGAQRDEGTVLQGDYDGNGVVDGDDFLVWQAQFGASGDLSADGDRDGDVDGDDFLIWQSGYEQVTAPQRIHAVLEPSHGGREFRLQPEASPRETAHDAVWSDWSGDRIDDGIVLNITLGAS